MPAPASASQMRNTGGGWQKRRKKIILDMHAHACYYEVMVNMVEIIMKSKLASNPTVAYTDTVENAVANVRHFLGRGQYDSATVYNAERQPVFRARRWFTNVEPGAPMADTTPATTLRLVPQGVNPYEFAARIGKAGKLADAMHRHGITKADALMMDETMWKLAAMGAGVKPPSSVTQMLAIEQLARLEAAAMRGAA